MFAAKNEPGVVTKKFELFLFPDSKTFYKIALWLLLFLLSTLLIYSCYSWAIRYSDNQREIRIRTIETDGIKKAWNYLYSQQNKNELKAMDSVYYRSFHDLRK